MSGPDRPPLPRAAEPPWTRLAATDREDWPPADPDATLVPISWDRGDPRIAEFYDRATAGAYAPAELDWAGLAAHPFSAEQRVAVAYWLTLHGTFEAAGVLTFAHGLIALFEAREQAAVRDALWSVVRDEHQHDELAARACAAVLPGFPHAHEPVTELERAAHRNLAWVQSNVGRYWAGYQRSAGGRRIQAVLSSFAVGEGAGTGIFGAMGAGSTQPVLGEMFRLVARDEARHFRLAQLLMTRYVPGLDGAERAALTRGLVASWVYFSVLLDEPNERFWSHLPPSWLVWHRGLEEHARAGGLGILPLAERRQHWRRAMLAVGAILAEQGLELPAVPELDLAGPAVSIGPADVQAVSL